MKILQIRAHHNRLIPLWLTTLKSRMILNPIQHKLIQLDQIKLHRIVLKLALYRFQIPHRSITHNLTVQG